MPAFIDFTGKQFGRLHVLERAENVGGRVTAWKSRCSCGSKVIVRAVDLRSGRTTSCGCLRSELMSLRQYKHGGTRTRLYRIWQGMKDRCLNPRSAGFKWYGAKGVNICASWRSFVKFRSWSLSNGYADDLVISREQDQGDYTPANCVWVTRSQNCQEAALRRWT